MAEKRKRDGHGEGGKAKRSKSIKKATAEDFIDVPADFDEVDTPAKKDKKEKKDRKREGQGEKRTGERGQKKEEKRREERGQAAKTTRAPKKNEGPRSRTPLWTPDARENKPPNDALGCS
ncbi:predicted protein [Verticillium alfalfae VaMs.102]|uniref:Predicted protein n=1 Tax=Verticillium alfalfae (strain VaMs.102 / ATCC MYA-4576 / FGSC 10136) TaxID=526221 RepID=C9SC19_VERA1|nr:predicted protein [Verticillium alfalfae VaMs.102]EEY15903.1 predicted protein [Verticillium alfalfae VaMs.102]